jgi:hypothetical protein
MLKNKVKSLAKMAVWSRNELTGKITLISQKLTSRDSLKASNSFK